MTLVDIEAGLSNEEQALRDVAHRFARDVLRPAGTALDRLQDPAEVIAEGSVLWEVFRQYGELGFDMLDGGDSQLDAIQQARLRAMINEELGWGDAGLAISLGAAGFVRYFAQLSGNAELIERFAAEGNTEIGCWAVTEPDHGSDTLAFTERSFHDPGLRANCVAKRDGDDWIINGQKAAWVSNGGIAHAAALFCNTDPTQGFSGGGVALVPLDTKGVSRGKPLDKLGQRALNQAAIFFDDVRIPASYMLYGPDAYETIVEMVLTLANAGMGTVFVGVARAAFEHAVEYAHERVQGGRPIAEHQSVKARLFKMFTRVEAARSLARRVSVHNSTAPPLIHYSIASKVFCTDVAFETASAALQIFGGNGLTREYPIEKLMRDARASMIEDGCNELLSLVGGSRL